MKRIAIVGGGISGLTAAYECHKLGLDWHLYEASDRLGGIIATTRYEDFILESGPDGWVSEKPAARELAIELGLERDLLYSNDATRRTYVVIDGKLEAMPDRMRLMVPEDLATLEGSPLFSSDARAAYAHELASADELQRSAPEDDESVASFVRRHFGEEVLAKLAAPLLSGVFGGDVERLSVQSTMPAFVAMEREHGSLIAALAAKRAARSDKPAQPIFTSLRNGVASLSEALVARLPPERVHCNQPALSLKREGKLWCVRVATPAADGRIGKSKKHFHHVFVAASLDATRTLLAPIVPEAAELLPREASSALLVNLAWESSFDLPQGFGFVVAQKAATSSVAVDEQLLACTFADQKFAGRAPGNGRLIRAFFGGTTADALFTRRDADIAGIALAQLRKILGPLPEPLHSEVVRWPRSLPQYEVGHCERIAELQQKIAAIGQITLLGNSYEGVGLPDLIAAARIAVRGALKS